MPSPEICPQCGAAVPTRALACPECGSDDQTGWSEEAEANRLGIPSSEFDYEEFVEEEFGTPSSGDQLRPKGIRFFWWIVAVILLTGFLLTWVF